MLRAASLREVVGNPKLEARGSFFYCFYLFTEDTQVTGQVSQFLFCSLFVLFALSANQCVVPYILTLKMICYEPIRVMARPIRIKLVLFTGTSA